MKYIIALAAILCVALIGGGIYAATRPYKAGPRTVPLADAYAKRLSDGGWKQGSATAPVELVEYADFECPTCGFMYPIIKSALTQTGSDVAFRYRDYPLTNIHPNAQQAALAAEAAGRQAKFWEMHDMIFENQTTWSSDTPAAFRAVLEGYVTSLGLDLKQYDNDLQDPTLADPIASDVKAGSDIKLTGTPTMLINGKEVATLPRDAATLVSLLEAAKPAAQ